MRALALALLVALAPDLGRADAALAAGSVRSQRLATCAALWDGYAAVLGDGPDEALARRFEAEAARHLGPEAARAAVEERGPWMVDLLDAYIRLGDDQSRALFDRLMTECGELGADLPG